MRMPRISPTLEGFRAAWRRPSLTFAEISWRWVVGASVWALLAFSFVEYLRSLPVSNGELFLLRSHHPGLMAQAIAHIMRGSFSRVALSASVGALGLAFLWMIVASLGRAATVSGLLDYFAERKHKIVSSQEDHSAKVQTDISSTDIALEAPRAIFNALFGLNFLRVALALAAILGFVGAAILAGFVSTESNPRPGLAFLLFLPLAGLICFAGWQLNWFLSLAALFAVRNGEETLAALSSAVAFSRERAGAVFAVSTWFGLAHMVLLVAANTAISMPLGFVPIVPGRVVLLIVFFLSLFYFAIADWLYMGRLAGYVFIAETPEALLSPPPIPSAVYFPPPASPVPQSLATEPSVETTIDREERILSDIPTPPVP